MQRKNDIKLQVKLAKVRWLAGVQSQRAHLLRHIARWLSYDALCQRPDVVADVARLPKGEEQAKGPEVILSRFALRSQTKLTSSSREQ